MPIFQFIVDFKNTLTKPIVAITIPMKNLMIRNQILIFHLMGIICLVGYGFIPEKSRNKVADLSAIIGLTYYFLILVYFLEWIVKLLGLLANYAFLRAEIKLKEKIPPFIMLKIVGVFPILKGSFIILFYIWLVIGFFFELKKIGKGIKHRLFFENRDPRSLTVEELNLSLKVEFVLRKEVEQLTLSFKGKLCLDKLILTVLFTPESIREIEGLDDQAKNQIFLKIYNFINSSYALTALFYSNHEKLKVKAWWYILFVIVTRKDPQFRFIPELGLSTRVTILLLHRGIYMIEELVALVSNTQGCQYLLYSIDDLEYDDLLEIFTKLESWYVMVRKRKGPGFKFITQLNLSERLAVLLVSENLYTINELKKTISKSKSCKALLEIEDFVHNDFVEIFTKVEWWYRLIRKRKDSVFQFITELGLSPRVTVLLLHQGINTVGQLKETVTVFLSRKALLERKEFSDADFVEIFTKVEWWYRLIRKRKDSVFQFITELGLSPRVTVLLLYQGIDTVSELKRTIKDLSSRRALLEIEDFLDEDFVEIFTKIEWWYRLIRKRKSSVFRFITELGLSPRVTVLLLGKGLSTIDQLQLTLRDPEARESLIQMEDFETEHLLEIFKKVDW
jgi:hypothetical protein